MIGLLLEKVDFDASVVQYLELGLVLENKVYDKFVSRVDCFQLVAEDEVYSKWRIPKGYDECSKSYMYIPALQCLVKK